MMAAQDLPSPPEGADVPEWIQLTPAGRFETFDARGPYEVTDPQAVIEASFAARGEIEIDVNHAPFTAAKAGGEAPARGWIVEMQVREDGIWGKVRWTKEGARLVADQAYRRISPVFRLAHPGSNRVVAILNASLVNRQNLRGLAALNFEEEERMSFLKQLAGVLDLGADATEEQVTTAVNKLKEDGDVVAAAKATAAGAPDAVALQSALTEMQDTIAAQAEQIAGLQGAHQRTRPRPLSMARSKRVGSSRRRCAITTSRCTKKTLPASRKKSQACPC